MRTAKLLSTLTFISALVVADLFQDVTQTRFEALLQSNDLLVTAFTSQALESLEPFHDTFARAAANVSAPFAMIDCDQEVELCKSQDINAYPTIRLLEKHDGHEFEAIRYRGQRTKKAIRSFVRKHELPILTHIQPHDIQTFKTIDDVVVVAYLSPDDEALLRTYQDAAESHNSDYVFGYVTDAAIADAEAITVPSIVCYKNLDGDHKGLSGQFAEADVQSFLKEAGENAIKEFRERDMEDFMLPGRLTTYIFTTSEEEATAMRHELTPLAKKYENFVTFALTDIHEYAPMAENFGINEKLAFPALVVHAPMNDNVFLYRQGKKVVASIVEAMFATILHGKAISGQVFGGDAPETEIEPSESPVHTEL